MKAFAVLAVLAALAQAGAGAAEDQIAYAARGDFRKCRSPFCGGYFIKRVNYELTLCADGVKRAECYVAAIDWGLFEPIIHGFGETSLVVGALGPYPSADKEEKELGQLTVSRVFEGACGGGCQVAFKCTGPPEGCTMLPAPYDGCGCPTGCGQVICGGPVCSLEREVGPCDAAIPRWWYNSKKQECERFIYGGCEGNANNFDSKAACEGACGFTSGTGSCPNVDGQIGVCVELCGKDGDCGKDEKCCSNGCGHVCTAVDPRPDPTAACQPYSCRFDEYCVERDIQCITTPCFQYVCKPKNLEGEACDADKPCARGLYCVGGKCAAGPGTFYGVQDNGGICDEPPCVSFDLERLNRDRVEKFMGQVVATNAKATKNELGLARELARPGGEGLVIHTHRRYEPPEVDGRKKKRFLYAWELFLEQVEAKCSSSQDCVFTTRPHLVTSPEGCYCPTCPQAATAKLAARNEAAYARFGCAELATRCLALPCPNPGVPGCSKGTCTIGGGVL